jgi:Streptomyces sporulation and cell division protein, SsgA
MITLVRQRLRARPVSEQGRLSYGGYMELSYDLGSPYAVTLAETGPDTGEVVFARDLLITALNGDPAGEGLVRARLRRFRGARRAQLALTVPGADGPLEFALCEAAVAAFVAGTTDLVPQGEEWRYLEVADTVDGFLGQAA